MCCAMLLLCCAITWLCFTMLASTVAAHTPPQTMVVRLIFISRGRISIAGGSSPPSSPATLRRERHHTGTIWSVSVCLSVCLSVHMYKFVCPSVCLPLCIKPTCMYDMWRVSSVDEDPWGRNVVSLPLAYFVIASTHAMLMTWQWDPKAFRTITIRYNSVVKEAPLGTCQVKLHNPGGSGNVCPESKEKISDLREVVYVQYMKNIPPAPA